MKALDKIMELLEVTTDVALAKRLGMKNSARIGSWRSRGHVSEKALREWELKFNKPRGWFTDDDEIIKAALGDIETALIGMMKGVSDDVKKDIFMNAAQIISGGNKREKQRDKPQ